MKIAKKTAMQFVKNQAEPIISLLTNEHRLLVEKVIKWVEIADEKANRNAVLEERMRDAELYSAKTNPVL